MTPDSDPLHIAYREILHIWGAIPLYVWALAALWLMRSRLPGLRYRIAAAVAIEVGVILNEIHDLARGGWWGKSAIDLACWAAALAALVWGVRQFEKRR